MNQAPLFVRRADKPASRRQIQLGFIGFTDFPNSIALDTDR